MELASLTARAVFRRPGASKFAYPIAEKAKLKDVVAQHLGVDSANVIVGAGSDALLKATLLSLIPSDGSVAVTVPGDDLLAALSHNVGRRVHSVNFDAIMEAAPHSDAILLASPDYPSRQVLSRDMVRRLCANSVVLIDQAYHEYVARSGPEDLSRWIDDRTVLFRTCSKYRGRPDLRVGWAVTSAPTAWRIESELLPFPCSGVSLDEARLSLVTSGDGQPGPGVAAQLRATERLEIHVRALGHDVRRELPVPWLWIPNCDLQHLGRTCGGQRRKGRLPCWGRSRAKDVNRPRRTPGPSSGTYTIRGVTPHEQSRHRG